MTGVVAFVAGYLVGGLPTADWLAARSGIDLREEGSGNPGANNALRLGGRRLAAQVLGIEGAKGVVCVAIGGLIGGDVGVVAAGTAAVAGNILNPYRGLRGGQGLAIAAGILLAATPIAGAVGIATIAVVARLVHATAPAALVALMAVIATSGFAPVAPWGLMSRQEAVWLTCLMAVVIAPKQIGKIRSAFRPPAPGPG